MQNDEGDAIIFEPGTKDGTWELELNDGKPLLPKGFYVTLTKQQVNDILAGIQTVLEDWS